MRRRGTLTLASKIGPARGLDGRPIRAQEIQQALLNQQALLAQQGLLALKRSNKPCRQPHFPTTVPTPTNIFIQVCGSQAKLI